MQDRSVILVINAGSSSIKFATFDVAQTSEPELISRGEIEDVGTVPHLMVMAPDGSKLADRRWESGRKVSLHELLRELIDWIESHNGRGRLIAAGHRVATGGLENSTPVLVTDATLKKLRALVPLAPLHQPRNIEPIEVLAMLHPLLPQVACFDTAFHRTMPDVTRLYGLPRALGRAGAHRYGFSRSFLRVYRWQAVRCGLASRKWTHGRCPSRQRGEYVRHAWWA